jgi:hypothetical protein
MSLITVVKDVCHAVGLNPPTSMFATSIQPRTQAELLSLANEMAQRIAYDVREWTALKAINSFTGDGVKDRFVMPANYKRMLLSSQVYSSWMPSQPLRFISDTDVWLARRLNGETSGWSEWTLLGDSMLVFPVVPSGQTVSFAYLDKNCIRLSGGGYGDRFINDADEFRLPERLLKLGMIWQWKANKGSPYAEDMGTYSDALVNTAGADQPSPIMVDHRPVETHAVLFSWTPPS